MKNIRILDCTLRDGGRIIDCAFPDQEIKELAGKLANAKIDIVEIGFLRDCRFVNYKGNSTFFTDVEQIKPFLDKTRKNVMYVAFIDYGMFDFTTLKPFDGTSIDGIRFGFTKRDFVESHDEVMQCIKIIKQKGYQLFIQGVNSLNYSDLEVLRLVDMINEVHPYSFGIVDTYGAMYMDDIDRIYSLIDHNMDSDICINFHSHNNYQLSFALAQEVIRLSKGVRQIIIDGTLSGMGKVAGNLNTELIVDYLVRKLQYDYELDNILDIIDDYIQKYSAKYSWGYSIPAMMAGIYKAHPNNIVYLTEKFRLETKDISNLLSMISPQERQRYDYDNSERIYMEYIADKLEDYDTINELKKTVEDKEAFVLVPGDSINTHKGLINKYISEHNPIIFSVNYIAEYMNSFAFFGNQKRYNRLFSERQGKNVILSSNVKSDSRTDHIVNYHSLINRGYKYFENSTIMLFNLLKKLNPDKITIAGFDGFRAGGKKNYLDASFPNERNKKEFDILNREIKEMYLEIVNTLHGKCEVKIITPSIYDKK